MFFREKKVKNYSYLLLVENKRINDKIQQRVLANLGQIGMLRESGQLDNIITSASKFSEKIMVINAHKEGLINETSKLKIGGPLIFERLWKETGCKDVIQSKLSGRKFQFDVERAIFSTVLHRLFDPGSDRACEKWMQNYSINGIEDLQLQHFYRAMAWLGESLEETDRTIKDEIEEEIFQKRRDIFTTTDMVFFDTTSIYFEGNGGETLGQYGYSKDHRPDLKQIVVGAVLDNNGYPVCCELWPGNMADVKTLIPVAKRLKKRFGIGKSCLVADRGMISDDTIEWLEDKKNNVPYILGARMRRQKEVSEEVLSRAGRYQPTYDERGEFVKLSSLKIKEVWVENRRYIVCYNEDQAVKDALDRGAIISSLEDALKDGDKRLVGNKGYRKYLKNPKGKFEIDYEKIQEEKKFDGKWVLRTNTDLPAIEVVSKYKQLWMVEDIFRSMKSVLSTRPVYHKCDETIRGHVFCSFLAMILMKELKNRLEKKDFNFNWKDVICDLDNLEELGLEQAGKKFNMRIGLSGCAGKVFQASGVGLPPAIRLENEKCSANNKIEVSI